MALSCSSQYWEIWMESACTDAAAVDMRCSFAYVISLSRYSGYSVFRMSKKYYLGALFPAGYLSGKYCMKWESLQS